MKLIFASRNENKFLEIEKIIPKKIQLGNLNELNFYDEIPENEETIEGMLLLRPNLFILNLV